MRYADNPVDSITPLTLMKVHGTYRRDTLWVARTYHRTPDSQQGKDLAEYGSCPRDAAVRLGHRLDQLEKPTTHPLVLAFGDITKVIGGFDANTTD